MWKDPFKQVSLFTFDKVDEAETFEGSENSLTMKQTYTHEFQCQYQLNRYPFDTQVWVGSENRITDFVAPLDVELPPAPSPSSLYTLHYTFFPAILKTLSA